MEIVDRKTFLKLPDGTVFQKYEPCIFGDLSIKECLRYTAAADYIDFYYQTLNDPFDIDFIESDFHGVGSVADTDLYCVGRDGLFDDDQLFAVWSNKDVESLIERLKATLE